MNTDELIAHYQALLKQHGASAEAVQWADADTQFRRFDVLTEISKELTSVLDVGCGLASLHQYLRAEGIDGNYLGVDIVPEFVEIAQKLLANDPHATTQLITPEETLPKGYDYAILSGVFNNKMDDNWGFMTSMLHKMYDAAELGIAFNAMSSYVDFQDDDLFYVDPADILKFCKQNLGGHPVLRHDYMLRSGGYPFEFVMYVYKTPQVR